MPSKWPKLIAQSSFVNFMKFTVLSFMNFCKGGILEFLTRNSRIILGILVFWGLGVSFKEF